MVIEAEVNEADLNLKTALAKVKSSCFAREEVQENNGTTGFWHMRDLFIAVFD